MSASTVITLAFAALFFTVLIVLIQEVLNAEK